MIKKYYKLTKPGIIFGNVITCVAGFVLASRGNINYLLFLATLIGLSCIIASACIFNNYIDRFADKKMTRTQSRPLATGAISEKNALIFAAVLGLIGTFALGVYTNLLTLAIALFGFFIYVVAYSFMKYRTTHATLLGSISGASPPLVGYCAVTGQIDLAGALLFAIVVLWQMPHFFAIAMYRFNEYSNAGIPVLPVKSGMRATKIQILIYTLLFILVAPLLTLYGYTGSLYLIGALFMGLAWLVLCIQGFKAKNDKLWARKMFLFSLVVITVLSTLIIFDRI